MQLCIHVYNDGSDNSKCYDDNDNYDNKRDNHVNYNMSTDENSINDNDDVHDNNNDSNDELEKEAK